MERKEFRDVASRGVNRARVRPGLEQPRARVGPEEVIRGQDGNFFAEPSGDELVPPVSHATLSANASFPVLDPPSSASGNPDAP